jgi:hypothetical protein
LYSALSIIRARKSKKTVKAGHVASMGDMINASNTLVEKTEGNSPLGRHKSRRKTILKRLLKKYSMRVWNEFIWLWIENSGGLL